MGEVINYEIVFVYMHMPLTNKIAMLRQSFLILSQEYYSKYKTHVNITVNLGCLMCRYVYRFGKSREIDSP
ncbi:hypothetical protein QE152_g38058 [Popillia japonica]|uniref:Uncharacterized protein n=1 Tax=Popillia japonica TaxID=7064 RepID=A0AAW1I7U9_POPJA